MEGIRHVVGQRSTGLDIQPPPGLHRMVLGQINSQDSGDTELIKGRCGSNKKNEMCFFPHLTFIS